MKKTLTILLALLMMLSCTTICFAAEESKDVLAKYIGEDKWTEASVSGQTETVVELPDGTTVTVANAPSGAVKLFIYSIPNAEAEAWAWIKSCFEGKGTPIHTFDIYFADENGNRINADGAVVTIDCPHCTAKPMVCSLTTDGTVNELSNNARSVSVTFTTDGSPYYVMAEKASAPVDDDHKVDVKDPTGGNVDISDKTPNTGDNSHLGLWITMAIISAAMLIFLFFWKRKKLPGQSLCDRIL